MPPVPLGALSTPCTHAGLHFASIDWANDAHAAQVANFWNRNFTDPTDEFHFRMTPQFLRYNNHTPEAQPDLQLCVRADDSGAIVGTLFGQKIGDTLYCNFFCVERGRRGQKIGTLILIEGVRRAAQSGIKELFGASRIRWDLASFSFAGSLLCSVDAWHMFSRELPTPLAGWTPLRDAPDQFDQVVGLLGAHLAQYEFANVVLTPKALRRRYLDPLYADMVYAFVVVSETGVVTDFAAFCVCDIYVTRQGAPYCAARAMEVVPGVHSVETLVRGLVGEAKRLGAIQHIHALNMGVFAGVTPDARVPEVMHYFSSEEGKTTSPSALGTWYM